MVNRTAHRRGLALVLACSLIGGAFLMAITALGADELPTGSLPVGTPKPADFLGLKNVVRLSEKLYSGGVPEGDEGFQALQRLGVRTIISVDGMKPDVVRAKKFGIGYVHLPFGYDGCPVPTVRAIVKAVRDLPGPVYVHCHHGKHRSPTAAAFARIALDGIPNEQAVQEMERAGTGKNYTGLYREVQTYKPPTKEELDRLQIQFREVAPLPPLTQSMVQIEQRFDRLSRLQKDGWKAQPGVDAAYEALQLQELYTELNRTQELRKRPADFRKWMADSDREGKALEAALRAGKLDEASMSLGRLTVGCGSCHAKYRNVPQSR